MALGKFSVGLLALWMAFHVVMPLRSFAYTGPVDWHEQGYRFSWKVMTRKKNGAVTYRVSHEGRTRERLVYPSAYLTNRQEREMSGQPDLILQMAHHIGEDFEERGYSGLEVRVDAFVSWNGRKPARLIDSGIDLLTVDNSLHEAHWIEEAPTEAPPHLGTKLYEGWK